MNGHFARNLAESAVLRYDSRYYRDDGLRIANDYLPTVDDFELSADFRVTEKGPLVFVLAGLDDLGRSFGIRHVRSRK